MTTTVFGVETHYQVIGKGQPLILLHGWGCTWEIWYPVIAELSKNYQLILPDLPAFGESKLHSDDWNSFHFARWLDAFIQKVVGDSPFSLMGHSFGGKIAAIYASTVHPLKLKKLFLVDISGIPVPLPTHKKLQERMLRLIPSSLKKVLTGAVSQRVIARIGAQDYQQATPQQKTLFKHVVKEDITNIFPGITVPTQIIWGEIDADTPVTHAQTIAKLVPKSNLTIFAEVGHFPFIEKPQEFAALVR